MSDIPPGWKLERVASPAFFLLPSSDRYRDNYDRIFGIKNSAGSVLDGANGISDLGDLIVRDCVDIALAGSGK